jgi:hypothetical protein
MGLDQREVGRGPVFPRKRRDRVSFEGNSEAPFRLKRLRPFRPLERPPDLSLPRRAMDQGRIFTAGPKHRTRSKSKPWLAIPTVFFLSFPSS